MGGGGGGGGGVAAAPGIGRILLPDLASAANGRSTTMLRFGSGFGRAAPREAGSSVARHPTKIRSCIFVMRACSREFTNH